MEEKHFSESYGLEGMEDENQEAEHPMSALMDEALTFRKLSSGDIVDGQIVSASPTEILVDVGAKSEGVVRGKELESLGRQGLENLKVGDTLPFYVVRPEDRDGTLVLSIRRAEEENDWREAQKLFEDSTWFETQVAGFNKGGLIVRMGKLRGFVPASQLSRQHQGSQKLQPEERWSRLVGDPINVKIIEINRKRKRLILSERAALRQWRESQKEKLLEELREGEVRSGEVSSLSDFGAFVDLGGADGLVHLSELSWNRSAKPADILEIGQTVEVYVLGVNREKKRIALSLKRLEPEPWSTVESRYYEGQLVEGTITRLTNFGAFALVNDEIEGLIHISELSGQRINHPQEVVQEGQKHVMRILRIDPKRRRMGLSLVRVSDPSFADLDWRAELAEAESSLVLEEADDLVDEVDLIVAGAEDLVVVEAEVTAAVGEEAPVVAEQEGVVVVEEDAPAIVEEEAPVVVEAEAAAVTVKEIPVVAEAPAVAGDQDLTVAEVDELDAAEVEALEEVAEAMVVAEAPATVAEEDLADTEAGEDEGD